MTSLRKRVESRSAGLCEVIYQIEEPSGATTYKRCAKPASDIHHMLTRARGGQLLDAAGEIYHLLHVCRPCHQACDEPEAFDSGLMIDGHVYSDQFGTPVYVGPDAYLSLHYPKGEPWA